MPPPTMAAAPSTHTPELAPLNSSPSLPPPQVPACTFDAPTRKAAYLDCEAKAAGDWRAAVNALRKWAHTNDEAITAESAAKAATSNRLRELLRYASLHRKGLNEPLDANSLTMAFELARRY